MQALAVRPLRRLGLLATVVALSACGSSAPAEPVDYPVASAEGRFSVVFPAKPASGLTEGDVQEGKRPVSSLLAKKGSEDFAVTWSDVPKTFLANGPVPVLEAARDTVLANAKATIVSSDTIDLAGKPGLAVVAKVPEGATKADYHVRFYLSGTRIYEVLVIRNDPKADDTLMLDFFDSFTLTGS